MLRDCITKVTSGGGVGSCFVTRGQLTTPDVIEDLRHEPNHRRETFQRTDPRFGEATESGELPRATVPEDFARDSRVC
jgi:hypothetical protein